MDMVEEAANLTRFRHNFRNTEDIIFPEPKLCKRFELNNFRTVMKWMGSVTGVSQVTPNQAGLDRVMGEWGVHCNLSGAWN